MTGTWSKVVIVICIAYALTIAGCGGGGSDSGTAWYGGGDSGGTTQGYLLSGTLRDAMTNNPVQDAECTLLQTKSGNFIENFLKTPKETVTVGTTTTDQNGRYSFTGVPSGTYTLKFTRTDYVTFEVQELSVTQDTTGIDREVVQASQWTQMAGTGYPYDATKDYVIAQADLPAKGARVAGVTASITPSTGIKIGYFTDSNPSTIDWNATSTYSTGRIIFYGLTPGAQYTISFSMTGYTFPTFSVNAPGGGGVVQSYNIYATAPTPSPNPTTTPSPTPTPSPSTSPSPAPSPTQTGGGGGGAAATYTVTYDGNGNTGGAVPVDNKKYQQGAAVTVLGNTGNLVKANFAFAGWNTKADGTGTDYAADDTFNMGAANVTLYAKWTQASSYKVTYDGNGSTDGAVPVDGNTYLDGDEVTVLGNTGKLVRINDLGVSYGFVGWSTEQGGGGNTYTAGQKFNMGTADVTLYAKWNAYAVGDTGPAGGLICHDKGAYSDDWRYLEAAPESTEWSGIPWGDNVTPIPDARETAIGKGPANTNAIIVAQGAGNTYAAQLCDALECGGYSDWFLPSKDELNTMYTNLKVENIGGFADDLYWSSSEFDAEKAYGQSFELGGDLPWNKLFVYYVRAVRAF